MLAVKLQQIKEELAQARLLLQDNSEVRVLLATAPQFLQLTLLFTSSLRQLIQMHITASNSVLLL